MCICTDGGEGDMQQRSKETAAYGNPNSHHVEWEERLEKWKIRQEKRGLLSKEAVADGSEEDDFM